MWEAGSHGPCALVVSLMYQGPDKTVFDRQAWVRFGLATLGCRGWESRQKVMQIKSRDWSPSPTIQGVLCSLGMPSVEPICKFWLF